ncbi:MAG TPA: hypothetical protein VMV92_05765 [Streptosporangiaceae bacterium]|nr:hypothetical protein [Streptosporangiaceae bacterium]
MIVILFIGGMRTNLRVTERSGHTAASERVFALASLRPGGAGAYRAV